MRQTWCEAEEIIQAALTRAEPLLENYQINLFLEKDLPLVRVDSKTLSEVLFTLLENASKYVPENTSIEISVKRRDGEMLEFSVSDEGRGVPEKLRGQIFDKFFRVSEFNGDDHAPVGTGLGLAIAKGIVEAQGGEIRATDAAHGSGAQFIFMLRLLSVKLPADFCIFD